MTFDEIGAALGITGKGAFMLYRSGIRKLQRFPRRFTTLLELAAEAERMRARREQFRDLEEADV